MTESKPVKENLRQLTIKKAKREGDFMVEYGLEIILPENVQEDALQAIRIGIEQTIDAWLSEPVASGVQPKHQIITIEEIEKLPWKRSNWVKKEDPDRNAKIGEDAWIRTSDCDSRLVKLVNEAPKDKKGRPELDLPPYVFSMTDDGGLVIRRAHKAKAK